MGNHSNKKPRQVVEQQTVDIGSIHRLVARVQLKDRIKLLEDIIKTHQPLINAMKVTQKAYQEGFKEALRQIKEAEQVEQAAKVPESSAVQEQPQEVAQAEPTPTQSDVSGYVFPNLK